MHRKLLVASLIVFALALSACGGAAEESAADDGVLKVAAAFPGVVTDQSWKLPEAPGLNIPPRPQDVIPMPNFDYGSVVTRKMEIQ